MECRKTLRTNDNQRQTSVQVSPNIGAVTRGFVGAGSALTRRVRGFESLNAHGGLAGQRRFLSCRRVRGAASSPCLDPSVVLGTAGERFGRTLSSASDGVGVGHSDRATGVYVWLDERIRLPEYVWQFSELGLTTTAEPRRCSGKPFTLPSSTAVQALTPLRHPGRDTSHDLRTAADDSGRPCRARVMEERVEAKSCAGSVLS